MGHPRGPLSAATESESTRAGLSARDSAQVDSKFAASYLHGDNSCKGGTMVREISRRRILKSIVVVAGAGVAGSVLDACGGEDLRDGSATYFPQSVASGDPKTDSVVLWTRAHDPAASGDLALRLQVATDAGFDNLVSNQSGLTATAAHDGSIKVKVTALRAGTTYYYRFIYQDARGRKWASRTGRTRTAHAAADDVTVRFAVLNCQDFIG